jgi:hypothetical protein
MAYWLKELRSLRASLSARRTLTSGDSLSKKIRTLQLGHSLDSRRAIFLLGPGNS